MQWDGHGDRSVGQRASVTRRHPPVNARDPHARSGERARRLSRVAAALGDRLSGKGVATEDATALLEAAIEPGDRVCLEGNNQKQADFLAEALSSCDPERIHDLHLVQSVLALP